MIRNALITGASSGVGKSIALELGRYCSSLALHYHRNLGEARSIQETLSLKNCRCKLFCYDLTDSEKAEMMVSRAASELGGLDALIIVIGPFSYSEIGNVTCQEWEKTIALKLHTCYHVTRHALPYLIHSRGHIVNFAFSGVEDLKAWPMSTAYCVSKAGIVILTKSLAPSLAPKGVRVNAICLAWWRKRQPPKRRGSRCPDRSPGAVRSGLTRLPRRFAGCYWRVRRA
ncbi:MAG: SDR family NAD(P)-dependent oxidoreductase [Methanotrichaceae archaeon]|nr:SDR family NAD(P)-dependent oxidoreductase [Methanotrichaceae archaeon]